MKILFVSPTIESTGNTSTARRIRKHLIDGDIDCILCNPKEILKNEAECNRKQLKQYLEANCFDGVIFLHAFKSGRLAVCSIGGCCDPGGDDDLHYGVIFGGTDLNVDIHNEEKLRVIETVLKNAKFCVAFNECFKEIALTMELDCDVRVQPQAIDIEAVIVKRVRDELSYTDEYPLNAGRVGLGGDRGNLTGLGHHKSYNCDHSVNESVVGTADVEVFDKKYLQDSEREDDTSDYNANLPAHHKLKINVSKTHSENQQSNISDSSLTFKQEHSTASTLEEFDVPKIHESINAVELSSTTEIHSTFASEKDSISRNVPLQYLFLMVSGIRLVKAPHFLLEAFVQWAKSMQGTHDLRLLVIGPILDEEYAEVFFEDLEIMKKQYQESLEVKQSHYGAPAQESLMSSTSKSPTFSPDDARQSTAGSGRPMSSSSKSSHHSSPSLYNPEVYFECDQGVTTPGVARMPPLSSCIPQFHSSASVVEMWMSSPSQFPILYSPPIARQDLLNLMRYKVFACVNSSESEGQSTAILEAMASCVPVIARENVGNESLITDGETGLLFANPTHFVEQAKKLITERDLRKSITRNALNSIKEKHSMEKEKIFYREICKKYFTKKK